MAKRPPTAFTVWYSGSVRTLKIQVGVTEHDGEPPPNRKPRDLHPATAIVDTGATGTSITEAFARELSLTQTGFGLLSGIGMDRQRRRTFTVDIGMPNSVLIIGHRVVEVPFLQDADILLGMDILTLGDLAITQDAAGRTVLSCRFPPGNPIDFVPASNEAHSRMAAKLTRSQPKSSNRRRRRQ